MEQMPPGLIPSAVGNTSIEEWAVGKDLFSAAVGRTVAALSSSPGSRLSGLLWYQVSPSDSSPVNLEAVLLLTLPCFPGRVGR